jgi:hypothetical protein
MVLKNLHRMAMKDRIDMHNIQTSKELEETDRYRAGDQCRSDTGSVD